jgi:hypothetical protein
MREKETGKKKVERELEHRATEEKRQWSGSTPTEDVMERALETGEEDGAGEEEGDGDTERRADDEEPNAPQRP